MQNRDFLSHDEKYDDDRVDGDDDGGNNYNKDDHKEDHSKDHKNNHQDEHKEDKQKQPGGQTQRQYKCLITNTYFSKFPTFHNSAPNALVALIEC